jgi:predicted nucleotidyltransferase
LWEKEKGVLLREILKNRNMIDINAVSDALVEALKPSDPYKVVLFGSYANGNPTEDSDVDIMVVLDNNDVSKTYEERLNKKVGIRMLIIELSRKIDIDLLVYSKEELKMVKEYGNTFVIDVEKTGKVIYEKVH